MVRSYGIDAWCRHTDQAESFVYAHSLAQFYGSFIAPASSTHLVKAQLNHSEQYVTINRHCRLMTPQRALFT